MQVRHSDHEDNVARMKERLREAEHVLNGDGRRFFKLFTEST
jgi:hypothetical protein